MDIEYIDKLLNFDLMKVLLVSVICGGMFGVERLKKNASVGIRTNIFLCLGSAIYTYASLNIPGVIDTTRVIAQIVSGIGFLCAGVIFKSTTEDRMVGLTTAALLFCLASIGILIGIKQYVPAIGLSFAMVCINIFIHKIEQFWYKDNPNKE